MAESAKQQVEVKFVKELTKIWLHIDGRVRVASGLIKVASDVKPGETVKEVVQPKLNERGIVELNKYRDQMKDKEAMEFPVGVSFPYPEGGLYQYLPANVKAAMEAQWKAQVQNADRFPKFDLEVDSWVVGNARIAINRLATPKAYELYCVPFPTTTGKKTAKKGAEAITTNL